jgi:CubicO group peptidase (beta-lactamase class C family)
MGNSVLAFQPFQTLWMKFMRKLLLIFMFVSLFSWIFLKEASGQDDAGKFIRMIENPQFSDQQSTDALTIEELLARNGVPGVSLAVIKDFKIHWAKGYGTADVKTGAKVDTETLFQAASISKTINAMAVLKAVQDGKFTLDTDVNTILKSWKIPDSPFTKDRTVTPRMLASHTSGLGDGFGFPGYDPSDQLPTIVQILKGEKPSNVGPVLLVRPPLTAFQYSGGGVTVLQLLLTDVFGGSYPDLIQKTVLGPVGMTQSTYQQPLSPGRDKNAARAHNTKGEGMNFKWHVYPELAAAGLWTTPTDLAKFVIEVQKSLWGQANNVLSQPLVKEMLSPVGVGDFAVGFSIAKQGQGWYFSHGGGNWGFRCILYAHKVKGYGLVIMTNSDNGGVVMNKIKMRIEQAYGFDSQDKPVPR